MPIKRSDVLWWSTRALCCPCIIYVDIEQKAKKEIRCWKDRRPPQVYKSLRVLDADENNQENSLWYRLPADLRWMIYEEYLGGSQVIKVNYRRRKFKVFDEFGTFSDVLALLLTCQKIYREAVDILYRTPIFLFSDPLAFLVFCGTLAPQHFHRIRHVRLDFVGTYGGPPLSTEHQARPKPHIGCTRYYRIFIDDRMRLQQDMTYWAFTHSNIRNWYNTAVFGHLPYWRDSQLWPGTNKAPSFWMRTCEVLSQMQGLTTLWVHVADTYVRKDDGIFGPLRMINGEGVGAMREFVVTINRGLSNHIPVKEDADDFGFEGLYGQESQESV